MTDRQANANAAYYQQLHDTHPAFSGNNWLLAELDALRALGGSSILEVGCGNGRFLELAAAHWERVVGIDWARSPRIDALLAEHANVRFLQRDATAGLAAGRFDIVASADFLEHLAEEQLVPVMRDLLASGRFNFHKIACYDDGHSHLSIFEPAKWLDLWRSVEGGQGMRIVSETRRKGPDKAGIVVANGPAAAPAAA